MNMNLMLEEFKIITGFENYEISNFGRVRNLLNDKYVSICIGNHDYKVVNLKKNGKFNQKLIHRLLAQEFIDNPDNLQVIDHIDENKLNNNLDNLRWITQQQNQFNRIQIAKNNTTGFKGVSW